jgi:hypothetical protein
MSITSACNWTAWGRVVVGASLLAGACEASQPTPARPAKPVPAEVLFTNPVIDSPKGTPRPPFLFSQEDQAFLEQVQHGAFRYLWEAASVNSTGMVPDRSSNATVSIAGVGFQLAAIPIGVEHGWITREEGRQRAFLILATLKAQPANRKHGLFYHFLDGDTAGQPDQAYEHVVSTIDSAIFFAGALTAGSYFGADIRQLSDELFAAADWKAFVAPDDAKPEFKGFISLGWKPKDIKNPTGPGDFLPYYWIDSGDEHRLVTFLAVAATDQSRRVDASVYYRLRRQMGSAKDPGGNEIGPMVWFPYSGALFTATFAHCWIDYAAIAADRPRDFGAQFRPSVNWWENSRRLVNLHRARAIENPLHLETLGENGWGLTASDYPGGYQVPGLFPKLVIWKGSTPELDYATYAPKDDYGDGTLAPYGAGSAIMFEPVAALAAMRHYQSLKGNNGEPLVWRDPSNPAKGFFGFQDAFNTVPNPDWAGSDCLAIDQGPLIVAIENARTGRVWDWFHASPAVQGAMDRLQLTRAR